MSDEVNSEDIFAQLQQDDAADILARVNDAFQWAISGGDKLSLIAYLADTLQSRGYPLPNPAQYNAYPRNTGDEFYLLSDEEEGSTAVIRRSEALDDYLFNHARRKPDEQLLDELIRVNSPVARWVAQKSLDMNALPFAYGRAGTAEQDTQRLINDKTAMLFQFSEVGHSVECAHEHFSITRTLFFYRHMSWRAL